METISLTVDHYIPFLGVDAVPTAAATSEPPSVEQDRKAESTGATAHATTSEATDSGDTSTRTGQPGVGSSGQIPDAVCEGAVPGKPVRCP